MLFNSLIFIFGFLPVALVATYAFGRWRQDAAKVTLLLLSLAFYAYWSVKQLPILLFSIVFNFIIGGLIQKAQSEGRTRTAQLLLVAGIVVDLGLLGWFKYANFVVDNVDAVTGAGIIIPKVALPLAISFFTFQKLAYLIDSARGETQPIRFLDFSLFAAFFPQLIAGPIVHFKEVVPQLQRRSWGHFVSRNLLVGLVLFAIGLFKKTVIADTLAVYVNPWFQTVAKGHDLGLVQAWLAVLSFTAQIYFDFSGYSDMAIGLGRMFGVKLPLNFHSPLRAPSIMDYWRRWHMTLQRFIVAYIFQPLSLPSSRFAAERGLKGSANFIVSLGFPTFVTFLAVGVWHGAGWTFALFGVMHAAYIIINEAWRDWQGRRRRKRRRAGKPTPEPGLLRRIVVGHGLTLIAVFFANVMFRAPTVHDAAAIWSSMTGFHGVGEVFGDQSLGWGVGIALATSILLIFLAPNSQQIMGRFDPAYNWQEWRNVAKAPLSWTWRPSPAGILFAATALFLGITFIQRGRAVFLYFNF